MPNVPVRFGNTSSIVGHDSTVEKACVRAFSSPLHHYRSDSLSPATTSRGFFSFRVSIANKLARATISPTFQASASRCAIARWSFVSTSPKLGCNLTGSATDAEPPFKPRDCHFGCEQCPPGMGGKMKTWYEKLPDWQMVLTWLILTFVAAVAYFFPVARLVGSIID